MRKPPKFQKEIVDLPLKFIHKAVVHRFTLPTGKEGCWESIYSGEKSTVLIAPITKQGKIVLLEMFRFPIESWIFELPGGEPETDDSEGFISTAKRELIEETGYDTTEPFEKLTQGWVFSGKANTSFVVYLARNCIKVQEPCLDPVEQVEGLRVVEQLPSKIMEEIAKNNPSYDLPISHALLSLLTRGIIKL